MDLEKLSKDLHPQDVRRLEYMQRNAALEKLQVSIEEALPNVEAMIEQYTVSGYVQSTVTVLPGLNCTFRSLSPFENQESVVFASKHEETVQNAALARRRLAHSLIEVNSKPVANTLPLDGSLFDLMVANQEQTEKHMIEAADKRYRFLSAYGLMGKISEAFAIWEQVVSNRVGGIEDMGVVIKKSMGDSAQDR